MSNQWPGKDELVLAFKALETAALKGSTISEVKGIVKVCLKYAKDDYKMVVFEIERYIIKSACEEGRMGGLSVVDSICRKDGSTKEREKYVQRFAKDSRIVKILDFVAKGISESNRLALAKVVHQWRKRNIFPSKILPQFEDLKDLVEGSSKPVANKDSTGGAPAGAAADGKVQAVKAKAPVKVSMKARRFCAFREGSCPFGDKCRFSHIEQGAHGRYMITRGGAKKEPTSVDDARDAMTYGPIEVNHLPSSKDVINVGMIISDTSFPFSERVDEKESFERHPLPDSFAVQEHVKLSWIKEKSIASL
jgi:hypothetical protein